MNKKNDSESIFEYDDFGKDKKKFINTFTPAIEIALSGINRNSVYYPKINRDNQSERIKSLRKNNRDSY